jgi:hypothetical protein
LFGAEQSCTSIILEKSWCDSCLITVGAMVGQHTGVLGPLVDLQIGLGREALLAVAAGVVALPLVHHLHVAAQLDAAGQQFAALRTREHLLRDHLTAGVHSMLSSPTIKVR